MYGGKCLRGFREKASLRPIPPSSLYISLNCQDEFVVFRRLGQSSSFVTSFTSSTLLIRSDSIKHYSLVIHVLIIFPSTLTLDGIKNLFKDNMSAELSVAVAAIKTLLEIIKREKSK